jgi:TusA-related sulfurtransferase
LQTTVVVAGFVDFEITWRSDVFSGAPQSSSAANFGTVGINFRARKPTHEAEWEAALQALSCEVPTMSNPILGADSFYYDAGDKGCGDGPLDDISRIMRQLAPGQTLEIRATDPSVAVDLPAWCRLTGNEFVAKREDRYLIRRRS